MQKPGDWFAATCRRRRGRFARRLHPPPTSLALPPRTRYSRRELHARMIRNPCPTLLGAMQPPSTRASPTVTLVRLHLALLLLWWHERGPVQDGLQRRPCSPTSCTPATASLSSSRTAAGGSSQGSAPVHPFPPLPDCADNRSMQSAHRVLNSSIFITVFIRLFPPKKCIQ